MHESQIRKPIKPASGKKGGLKRKKITGYRRKGTKCRQKLLSHDGIKTKREQNIQLQCPTYTTLITPIPRTPIRAFQNNNLCLAYSR